MEHQDYTDPKMGIIEQLIGDDRPLTLTDIQDYLKRFGPNRGFYQDCDPGDENDAKEKR
jgi:hypothetical protein